MTRAWPPGATSDSTCFASCQLRWSSSYSASVEASRKVEEDRFLPVEGLRPAMNPRLHLGCERLGRFPSSTVAPLVERGTWGACGPLASLLHPTRRGSRCLHARRREPTPTGTPQAADMPRARVRTDAFHHHLAAEPLVARAPTACAGSIGRRVGFRCALTMIPRSAPCC